MMNFFFQLGSLPAPPPPDAYETQVSPIVAHFIFGAYLFCVALVTLLYCSERFREFLARHVCAWMEEHAIKSEETKGGR